MPGAVELKSDIWTYQEYLELPPDGKVYQIIRGELYMVPAPATYHQEVAINLTLIIWNYVKKTGWGKIYNAPIDVIFTSTDIVQPDIVGISKDRFGIVKENGVFGAPDFVAEILSPSTLSIDTKLKKALYERHGVFEYWLVYPEEKKVESFLLRQGSYTGPKAYLRDEEAEVTSIPGLKVDLKEVF
ncbi:MAG TPA: Uma2 family endonuclease [Proteobacteria bacterium]|nr:Uma2 family endonuclease [Pseudomonadota bacterium]